MHTHIHALTHSHAHTHARTHKHKHKRAYTNAQQEQQQPYLPQPPRPLNPAVDMRSIKNSELSDRGEPKSSWAGPGRVMGTALVVMSGLGVRSRVSPSMVTGCSMGRGGNRPQAYMAQRMYASEAGRGPRVWRVGGGSSGRGG